MDNPTDSADIFEQVQQRHRIHATTYGYHNAFAGCYKAILRSGSPNLLD